MSERGEFYRMMPVHDLPKAGRAFAVEANAEERSALAARFGLLRIERLSLAGLLRPEADGQRVRLSGRLSAAVVQSCVVTLEPVQATLDVDFERLYDNTADADWPEDGADAEVFLDLDDEGAAEPLPGGVLDLGEVAAEQLALDIDPYPRAPGAVFAAAAPDAPGETSGGSLATLLGTHARNRKTT